MHTDSSGNYNLMMGEANILTPILASTLLKYTLDPATVESGIQIASSVSSLSVFPPYPGTALRRGMQGPSIRQVQQRLNELGANHRLATYGSFGRLTEAAVIAFQRANRLTTDGIVGDAVIIRPTQKNQQYQGFSEFGLFYYYSMGLVLRHLNIKREK